MNRVLGALVALTALATVAPASTVTTEAAGGYTHHTMAAAADGSYPARDYWVYVPVNLAPTAERALVTYLHGCAQTGDDAARGVGWNELADDKGFVVVYPEQHTPVDAEVDGNGAQCWNFWQAPTTPRGQGEIESIAQITRTVAAAQQTAPGRSFVLGASAGAMMATNEAVTNPDLYTALASVGGCSYMCTDPSGEVAYERMGAYARVMPTFVVTGGADYLTNPAMGELSIAQWLGTDDLADDGARNRSVPVTPASTEHRNLDALTQPNPTAGDACLHDFPRNPCVLGAAGIAPYPVTVRTYNDSAGTRILEAWLIHGLSHNYSGGSFAGTYTDPSGPDITSAIWEFFAAHAGANL